MKKSTGFFLLSILIIIFLIILSSCNSAQPAEIITKTAIVSEHNETDISAETSIKYPEPTGFVNDFAGFFTDDEISQINDFISDFEKETTAEILVVTVESLEGLSIEQYSLELFNSWGIGKEDVNNGVLLLISVEDKELRITTGFGLEKIVTDNEAGKIINDVIVPYFKESKYGQGALEGVRAIAQEISAGN